MNHLLFCGALACALSLSSFGCNDTTTSDTSKGDVSADTQIDGSSAEVGSDVGTDSPDVSAGDTDPPDVDPSDAVEGDDGPGDAVEGDGGSGDAVEGDGGSGDAVEGDGGSGDAVEGDGGSGDAVEGDAGSGDATGCDDPAGIDCEGVCGGTAVEDCEGVCGGTAVEDCEGVCGGPAVEDCQGVCGGPAVEDCQGVCGGPAQVAVDIYFTTNEGVFTWSPATPSDAPTQISTTPSYAIAVSSGGEVFVGTGGVEASATTIAAMGDPAIFKLDAAGVPTLVSATIAEDLQFSPSGDLHVANAAGVHTVNADGTVTTILANPTSQFAFESSNSLVTTCGDSHSGVFGKGTDRFDLSTGAGTSLSADGGEDIHVYGDGVVTLCGQGGIGEISASGAFQWLYQDTKTFNFGVTAAGDIYIGNQAQYDVKFWPQGLYSLPGGVGSATLVDNSDINAMTLHERCEIPCIPDCAGVCGGTAVVDCAGVCEGTAVEDCTGTCGGTAVEDCAGVCEGTAVEDCAGVCEGTAVEDCAGVCEGTAVEDCTGTCGGTAVEDCLGVCEGTAVVDCAGVCEGAAVEDCAGVCGGTAVEDCQGVCGGPAEVVVDVYFTTNDGVYTWSPATPSDAPTQFSTTPSYAIAVSPSGEVVVGTGGVEASATSIAAMGDPAIYSLDASGTPTLLSATIAEDLQFSPTGDLHVANSAGVHTVNADGTVTTILNNPTSQFAFESNDSLVTTCGDSHSTVFGKGTHRFDLTNGVSAAGTLVSSDGGEDIHVYDAGTVTLCGQGGIGEIPSGGGFSWIYQGTKTFNFGITAAGDIYIGNQAQYDQKFWPQGLFSLPSGDSAATQVDASDINAMALYERCEVPCIPDCFGVCGGTAVEDCLGVCGGTAVEDCAGVCEGTAVEDCAGVCEGTAVEDCFGVCDGPAEVVVDVYFTTNDGVYTWSPATPSDAPTQFSTTPSYAIAVSPSGEVFVGTGGLEASATSIAAMGDPAIYSLDASGAPTLVSATVAEDLQFSPSGDLHVANAAGVHTVNADGSVTTILSDPTSQFAFESSDSLVTTCGDSYAGDFSKGTHRFDLTNGVNAAGTLILSDGGEDIHVADDGAVTLCGQGGVLEILSGGGVSWLYQGTKAFNFGLTAAGDIYIGNQAQYDQEFWPQGLYSLPSGASTATQVDTSDINAMTLYERCE